MSLLLPEGTHTDPYTGLRCRITAGPTSRAVVLIHGMGGGLSNWRPLEDALDGQVTTINVELPWHGESFPYLSCDSVDDVVSLVARTLVRVWSGEFIAVGHSLGGSVALSLSDQEDLAMVGVVLVAGNMFSLSDLIAKRSAVLANRRLAVAMFRAFLGCLVPIKQPLAVALNQSRIARRILLPPFINPDMISNASLLGESFEDHTGRGTRQIYRVAKTADLAGIASLCSLPVSVICGDQDPLLAPADALRALETLKVEEYLVLKGCAHWPHLESPLDVAGQVLWMLESSPA